LRHHYFTSRQFTLPYLVSAIQQLQPTHRPSWDSSSPSRPNTPTTHKTPSLISTHTNHHLALPHHASRRAKSRRATATSNLRRALHPPKSPRTTLHHTTTGPPSPTPLCCRPRPPSATSHRETMLPGTMRRALTPSVTSSHPTRPRSPLLPCTRLSATPISCLSDRESMLAS
jgi:hypothetical protein